MELEFCCPTLFGLEGIVADELRFEGKLQTVHAENGRVIFTGNEDTLAWSNLHLRCAERVLIRLGTFKATSFDALFEGVRALPWENFIRQEDAFPVKGHSLNSALHSIPDCQRIIKKAIVERLAEKYHIHWFEETGSRVQIQFAIMNDTAEIYIDTTGAGLHKRGYRENANAAPLRETLAAAMVKLARWRGRDMAMDPFCGSGTILIEAAMIAMRRAPGMLRTFDAEQWPWMSPSVWDLIREEAAANVVSNTEFDIFGSDIDRESIALSMENARKAEVQHTIHFHQADATKLNYQGCDGVIFANPPYGERLLDIQSAEQLYQKFGQATRGTNMRQYIISSDMNFEHFYGRKPDKRRKLYNGMIRCDLNMYFKNAIRSKMKSADGTKEIQSKDA